MIWLKNRQIKYWREKERKRKRKKKRKILMNDKDKRKKFIEIVKKALE